MKWFKRILAFVTVLLIVYLLGPHPGTTRYTKEIPIFSSNASELEKQVAGLEALHKIKPDNQARIIWANDSLKEKTEYAIVYLHGFSASQEEGNPVHRNIAKEFNCNLFLSRLAEHGIDTSDAMLHLTAETYYESAKQALAIGEQLGEKIILMGTSTGASLALKLAADFPDKVAALILYSPNIAINDPNAWLLNDPWGLQIARLVKGSKYNIIKKDIPLYQQYWNTKYRLEGAVALEELLETTMLNTTFKAVQQPALVLYYYKDEQHQDNVVKVSAMKTMFNNLGTSIDEKRMIPVPNAGNHVIASPIQSKDIVTPQQETEKFLREVIGLKPVANRP